LHLVVGGTCWMVYWLLVNKEVWLVLVIILVVVRLQPTSPHIYLLVHSILHHSVQTVVVTTTLV